MTDVASETAERLLRFVSTEVSISQDPIDAETDLLLTGAVDSLGVIRITQWMEDELGVEVDPVDVTLENFQTVARMVAYLGRHQPA
ncbi:MAG: acyl carrier protein [Actinomycetota bacterium]